MCAIYAFSLLLSGLGLYVIIADEVTMQRKLSGPIVLRGPMAKVLGILWLTIGLSILMVALSSGTVVWVVAQLPDEVRFLVGIVRGISLCTVVSGIVVFLITMLMILLVPSGRSRTKGTHVPQSSRADTEEG